MLVVTAQPLGALCGNPSIGLRFRGIKDHTSNLAGCRSLGPMKKIRNVYRAGKAQYRTTEGQLRFLITEGNLGWPTSGRRFVRCCGPQMRELRAESIASRLCAGQQRMCWRYESQGADNNRLPLSPHGLRPYT
jgi:hypothetical protein